MFSAILRPAPRNDTAATSAAPANVLPRAKWFRIVFMTASLIVTCSVCGQSKDAQKLAALDQALKAGVISQEEYNAKVAELKAGPVDPAKKAALDEALKNGVLTQREYDAKLQALKAAPGKAAPTAGAGSSRGPTKTVAVVDTVLNMPAIRVTVPSDWAFDGAILRSACGDGLPFLVYRAYSPDKLSGIQWLPQADWYSAADTRAYKSSGVSPCNLHPPARAADVAPKIATDLRTGAKVIELPPLTARQTENLRKSIEQGRSQLEQMNRQFPPNFRSAWDLEMQRVKIRYEFEGHPVEEMLTVSLTTRDNPVPVYSTGPGGIIQPGIARLIHTVVNVNGIRAPAGKLEATIAALDHDSAVEMVPEWNEVELALLKKQGAEVLAIIRKNGEILRDGGDQFAKTMQTSNDRYHAWQQQQQVANEQKFAEDMRRKDSQAQNFLDYVKDQTYYVNPSTGQTITIKNQIGVSGYAGQNPSGGWTQLIPISH